MSDRIVKTEVKVDIDRLTVEAIKLSWDSSSGKYTQQVCVQTGGSNNWQEGTGSRPNESELQWDKLHPDLVGTWWEKFFADLPYKVYRTRVMVMAPRTCYSIHKDDSPRLHIALLTTQQSRFIFLTPPEIVHIPRDGYVWQVDTREQHTAINGSLQYRVHLIMSLDNNE